METRHCKITFWDLGGQEGLRTIWERYFPDADAIIYVVDTGDAERLYEAKAAFEHVMHNKKLDGLPVLVVANKQDHRTSPPSSTRPRSRRCIRSASRPSVR